MASHRLWRDKEKKIVILDSSAIMMLFEFSIDLEDELARLLGRHHIIVPRLILEELIFLSEHGKGKKRFIAKPALELVKKYDVVDVDVAKNGDDAVFYLAQKLQGAVVTNDRELRKKLREASLQTIYLRGKKRLVLE